MRAIEQRNPTEYQLGDKTGEYANKISALKEKTKSRWPT